jgi:hypothetical protein
MIQIFHYETRDMHNIYIVTWRLKAGIAEPKWTFIARQRLGKQAPTATNKQATIEALLCCIYGNGVFCWIRPEVI